MSRIVPAVLAILLATSLLVGCGGDQRAEYQRDLEAAGKVVADALDELPDGEASTIEPRQVRVLATHLRDAADELDDLDPQPGVAEAQDELEQGLRGVADAFVDLAGELERGGTDAEQAERFVAFATDPDVDEAFEQLVRAQEAFAEHDFRVFPKGTQVAKARSSRP